MEGLNFYDCKEAFRVGYQDAILGSRASGRSVEALILDIEAIVAREPENYFKHLLLK